MFKHPSVRFLRTFAVTCMPLSLFAVTGSEEHARVKASHSQKLVHSTSEQNILKQKQKVKTTHLLHFTPLGPLYWGQFLGTKDST